MKRAIVVYLEHKRDLLLQFGCLYTSYKFINAQDTDLVVFGTRHALELIPADCIKVEYEPVSCPKEWLEHRYINSISCFVSEKAAFLDDYDYLLKSDVDTFLTPAWNSYYPEHYTVGKGLYIYHAEVEKKVKDIASLFKLRHQGIHNIGSTHYGKPRIMREICGLSVNIAQHIMFEEFKDGPGEWPGWYKGVTLMYSNEIAVNHLVDNFMRDYEMLDFDSTSGASIFKHSHIHCWHTQNLFSKFKFVEGAYDNLQTVPENIEIIKNYCLYIAVKSKRELPL